MDFTKPTQKYINSLRKSRDEGFNKERQVLERLNKIAKNKFYKTTDFFNHFDFMTKDGKYNIELKSRNNTYNKYPTTIINIEKIRHIKAAKLEHPHKRFYFLFNFSDGLYYIKYKSKIFNDFNIKNINRHDRDIIKLHVEIPITKLKPIEKIKI